MMQGVNKPSEKQKKPSKLMTALNLTESGLSIATGIDKLSGGKLTTALKKKPSLGN